MAIGLVLAVIIGVVVALIGAGLAGVSTTGVSDSTAIGKLPELLLRGWLAIIEAGRARVRDRHPGPEPAGRHRRRDRVYFGESFATIFLPDIVKYGPFNAASAVVATSGGGGFGGGNAPPRLEPDTALIVVAAWLIAALLVTALFTERAEISG